MKDVAPLLRDLVFVVGFSVFTIASLQLLGYSICFDYKLWIYFTFQDYLKLPDTYPVFLIVSYGLGYISKKITGEPVADKQGKATTWIRHHWQSLKNYLEQKKLWQILKNQSINKWINVAIISYFLYEIIHMILLWFRTKDPDCIYHAELAAIVLVGVYIVNPLAPFAQYLKKHESLTKFGTTALLLMPLIIIASFFNSWFHGAQLIAGRRGDNIAKIVITNPKLDSLTGVVLYSLDKFMIVWDPEQKEIELIPQSSIGKIVKAMGAH